MIVKGATVVDAHQRLIREADLQIEAGKIAKIAPSIRGEGIKAEGCLLLPAFLDLHTHIREPGQTYKEPLETTLQAAAKGGYARLVTMANTDPVIDTPEVLEWVRQRCEGSSVQLLPLGAITEGLRGRKLSEMGLLKQCGAVGFSDDGRGVQDSGLMRKAMEYSQGLSLPLFCHCEEETLSEGGVMHEGKVSQRYGMQGISWTAETAQAARDILLAQETGCRVHLCHVSCRQTLEWVCWAKANCIPVSCEVAPHHLLFSEEALESLDSCLKVNPPLRTQEDVLALREALKEGIIDAVATDHAPHSSEEKELPIQEAPCGIVSLEEAFALLYALLVNHSIQAPKALPIVKPTAKLLLFELLALFTTKPAAVLALPIPQIKEGEEASFVLFDPKWKRTITQERWVSAAKIFPYEGMSLQGGIIKTILRGEVVYEV